ncbi:cobalt-precorrin-5B (C(1))-methyltransferase CbiD [Blautia schinkii]|uniref:cobalt-precorrin-5B (C(1))-methyltransferase CbiD n=1 Tax=Blautia schinkii TaxID=180164 RepID=UPI00156DA2CB|nr:cobalt-precorrin-5B (C(1))-methyltransferase CbiD [Blautia schinkii]NSK35126.1 cobalamin biosynthesis protein CbiD [Blautia schinkii]NSK65618.1 cobalamin biosynthesis protein CbiD [Blautia schinkii]
MTGLEDKYIIKNNKRLRYGYTTGSCAAGATRGAARMLLSGEALSEVELQTPKGITLNLQLHDITRGETHVSCAVQKDAGDDPDTTNGILVYAKVEKISAEAAKNIIDNQNTDSKKVIIHSSIILDGGVGVGRVTKPGLSQKVGEAAINPVPKAMILREAEEAAQEYDYEGYLKITISVPEGEEISKKTFNPRLGIIGGISILGTSGIVEPMSERALIASIQVEMKQHFCQGENYILVTPGNYGADYLREHMTIPFENNIKCSNYVGETIDMAIDMGVKGILFVAHIGKFVKVAAGIMNTHSHCADGRMEVLCASAIRAGGTLECAREILEAGTTDEALAVIDRYGILEETMAIVMEKIQFYLDHRSYEQILLGAVVFSNVYGLLGQTRDARKLMGAIQEQADAKTDKL